MFKNQIGILQHSGLSESILQIALKLEKNSLLWQKIFWLYLSILFGERTNSNKQAEEAQT
ncbi:hypothetical protein [Calothrix sp. NIES-2100]|uniref:hypothetical protein n=1 Tax=Calothrix sp. NIES-2100 TaxID=1954172 RepID=UPI000BBBE4DE